SRTPRGYPPLLTNRLARSLASAVRASYGWEAGIGLSRRPLVSPFMVHGHDSPPGDGGRVPDPDAQERAGGGGAAARLPGEAPGEQPPGTRRPGGATAPGGPADGVPGHPAPGGQVQGVLPGGLPAAGADWLRRHGGGVPGRTCAPE